LGDRRESQVGTDYDEKFWAKKKWAGHWGIERGKWQRQTVKAKNVCEEGGDVRGGGLYGCLKKVGQKTGTKTFKGTQIGSHGITGGL